MKCLNCGHVFSVGEFCPECGTRYEEQKRDDTLGESKLNTANVSTGAKEIEYSKDSDNHGYENSKIEQERLALLRAEKEVELTRLNNERIKLEQEQNKRRIEENYRKKVNLQAIWCLILSIVSIPLGFTGIGLIVAVIVSIVLGIFALRGKTEKKALAIAGLVIDAVVIIVMIAIVIWAFSDENNTHDKDDDVIENIANEDSEDTSIISNSDIIDLYEVRLLSETELIAEYGYVKNDFSMYPDESNMVISYDVDGNIYIVIAGDNKEEYEFYGLMIGDEISSIDSLISKKFTYLGEYSTNESDFIVYRDNKNENGYLRIEGSSKIVSINYFVTYEDLSDLFGESEDVQVEDVEDNNEEDVTSTTPYDMDITGEYEMLIGQSFIYASIQWVSIQHDDYQYISIEGVDETGKEYLVDGYLFECDEKYDCYFCYGNLKYMINVSGDTLDITTEDDPESYNREEKPMAYLFSGTYYKSYTDVVGGSNDVYCVVAAPDGYVNFRTGPGTNYDIIMPIYNGEELLVTGSEGGNSNWITVVYYDSNGIRYEGWVNQTQVKFE